MMTRRLLVISSLFPNAAQPLHGSFVANRVNALRADPRFEIAAIIAPVAWRPGPPGKPGSTAIPIPNEDTWHGIPVRHPRFLATPLLGRWLNPLFMGRAIRKAMQALRRDNTDWNIVDTYYLFPEAVAAARCLSPDDIWWVEALGSDVHIHGQIPDQRRKIVRALERADAIVCVAESLRRSLQTLLPDGQTCTVIENGVDRQLFHPPSDKGSLRQELNLSGEIILSVGNLIPLKGHHLAINSVVNRPNRHLLIAGAGPEKNRLRALANKLGIAQQVTFLGSLPPQMLAQYYQAADALVLLSESEGMPNVVLESLACGTPVIACNVGDISRYVTDKTGVLLDSRTSDAARLAADMLLRQPLDPSDMSASINSLDWANLPDLYAALPGPPEMRHKRS